MRDDDEDIGDAYWRRRAYALTGVLVTVGLLAWACTGDDERTEKVRSAGARSTPSVSGGPVIPAIPTAMPTITVTATARVTVTPTVPRRDGDACDPKAVVVHLAGAKAVYAAAEAPRFQVTVVNTGTVSCTVDVGPARMELRINSGSDRIWSSADCPSGTGSSIQLLRRGIPYLGTLTWDRRRSSAKCAGDRDAARKGTYVAVLRADGLRAKRQVFHLR